MKKFAVTLLVFVMVSGCDLLFPPEIQIVSFSPSGTLLSAPQPFVVRIEFNVPVSRQSAEKAFNLRRNGVLMAGRFSWSGDTSFEFLPVEPFQDGPLYIYRFETSLEDPNGKNLTEEFEAQFSSSTSLGRPSVVSIVGPNGPLTDGELWDGVLYPIVLTFDTSIPASSVESQVSFSPAVTGYWTPNAGRTAYTFQPSGALVWQTRYTLKVGKDLANDAGKTLGNEVTRWFFTGMESTAPSLVSVSQNALTLIASPQLNDTVETRDSLSVVFSEPILTDGLSSKIKLEPTAAMEIVLPDPSAAQTDTLTIKWTQGLAWDTIYTLKFLNTIKDPQGNALAETSYLLRSNGPGSRPPQILNMYLDTDPLLDPLDIIPDFVPAGPALTYHKDPGWTNGTYYLLLEMILNQTVFGLVDWRLLLRASLLQSWTMRPLTSNSSTLSLIDILVSGDPPAADGRIWVRITLSFNDNSVNSITEYTLPKSFVDPSGLSPLESWNWRLSH